MTACSKCIIIYVLLVVHTCTLYSYPDPHSSQQWILNYITYFTDVIQHLVWEIWFWVRTSVTTQNNLMTPSWCQPKHKVSGVWFEVCWSKGISVSVLKLPLSSQSSAGSWSYTQHGSSICYCSKSKQSVENRAPVHVSFQVSALCAPMVRLHRTFIDSVDSLLHAHVPQPHILWVLYAAVVARKFVSVPHVQLNSCSGWLCSLHWLFYAARIM